MHETLEKEMIALPKIKASYKTNVEGIFDQKRDSFYLRGGTYQSNFNENNSHVDFASKQEKMNTYRQFRQEQRMHAPIALVQADFRNVYNLSTTDRPQNNPLIAANPQNYAAFKHEMLSNRSKQRGVDSLIATTGKLKPSFQVSSPSNLISSSGSPEKLSSIKDRLEKVSIKFGFDPSHYQGQSPRTGINE